MLDSSMSRAYSPLEHIAKAVFGIDWREVVFAMYTAYYDCSGRIHDARGPSTTVACWVARVEKWLEFERRWRAVLDDPRFNVAYFRMTEFAAFQGPYANGWNGNEERRVAFLDSLARVIDGTLEQAIAIHIEQKDFDAVNAKYRLREALRNPFVMAARQCAEYVNDRLLVAHGLSTRRWANSVRHVFDRGDDGQETLRKIFIDDDLPQPEFEISWDDLRKNQRGVVQLQAADWFAWEMGKYHGTWDFDTNRDIRKSFLRLSEKVPFMAHGLNEWAIGDICRERKIPERT